MIDIIKIADEEEFVLSSVYGKCTALEYMPFVNEYFLVQNIMRSNGDELWMFDGGVNKSDMEGDF